MIFPLRRREFESAWLKEVASEALLESAPHLLVAADRGGSIVYANPAVERMFGYSAAELVGQPVEMLIPERFRKEHIHDRMNYASAPVARPMGAGRDLWGRRKDGSEFPVEVSLMPKLTEKGLFVLANPVDITERKRIERKLGESEERLRVLVDSTPDSIFFKDGEGRWLEANATALELFDLQGVEYRGKRDSELGENVPCHRDELRYCEKSDADAWASGRLARGEECIRKSDGTLHFFDVIKVPLFDADGKRKALIVVGRDITDRKKAEEERDALLRESRMAVQRRDEFLSISAHELKTPLTALSMQVQLLHRMLTGEAAAALPRRAALLRVVARSKDQLDQFTDLVDDLLNASRINAGGLLLDREEADLGEIVRRVLERYRDRIAESGSKLTLHSDPLVRGRWDPIRLEQVVVNLIGNALKYGLGNPVDVTVALHGDVARLSVRDRGIGIAQEDQQRIFERFERAASPRSFRGFGLGLYVTRRIVEAHGGVIRVESERGKGATFVVELPTREAVLPGSRRPGTF